jgi:hypothetical protein
MHNSEFMKTWTWANNEGVKDELREDGDGEDLKEL